jgi:hypothetical protein
VTSGTPANPRIRKRLAQIADRLGELRARSHGPLDPESEPLTDRERLARAAAYASQARAHAVEAAELAMAAYLRSAEVHERLAGLYERLAETGRGDVGRYLLLAEHHHGLAKKDRANGNIPPRRYGRVDAGQ